MNFCKICKSLSCRNSKTFKLLLLSSSSILDNDELRMSLIGEWFLMNYRICLILLRSPVCKAYCMSWLLMLFFGLLYFLNYSIFLISGSSKMQSRVVCMDSFREVDFTWCFNFCLFMQLRLNYLIDYSWLYTFYCELYPFPLSPWLIFYIEDSYRRQIGFICDL